MGGTGGLVSMEGRNLVIDLKHVLARVSREPPNLNSEPHHKISASEYLRIRIHTSSFLNTLFPKVKQHQFTDYRRKLWGYVPPLHMPRSPPCLSLGLAGPSPLWGLTAPSSPPFTGHLRHVKTIFPDFPMAASPPAGPEPQVSRGTEARLGLLHTAMGVLNLSRASYKN